MLIPAQPVKAPFGTHNIQMAKFHYQLSAEGSVAHTPLRSLLLSWYIVASVAHLEWDPEDADPVGLTDKRSNAINPVASEQALGHVISAAFVVQKKTWSLPGPIDRIAYHIVPQELVIPSLKATIFEPGTSFGWNMMQLIYCSICSQTPYVDLPV